MRKFNKNIAKEFKTSFGRFIAIMAIIALGVGFLIGVTQATPDMKNTMSTYLIDNKAYDIDVKGTFGLTQADIVESVTPVISTDAVVTAGEYEVVGRFIGIDNLKEYANASADAEGGNLNTLTLVEGEWPDAAGEVVVARANNYFEDVKVGDAIAIPEGIGTEQSTYGDVYAAHEFKVVGIVSSPDYYYNDAREVTTLGSGVVGCVVYGEMGELYDLKKSVLFSQIDEETDLIINLINSNASDESEKVQPIDVLYTDCYVKLVGSEEYERFTDEYKNFVLDGSESLENLGNKQTAALKKLIIEAESIKIGDISAAISVLT